MSDAKRTPTGPAAGPTGFTTDSDYDLLEMMTWRQTDPTASREAWAEFYQRHAKYLFSVCRKFAYNLGGDAAAEDLVSETFKHVYEKAAHTFKPSPSKDPDTIRLHVRAWLGTIAHNLAASAFRGGVGRESHLDHEQWRDVQGPDRPVSSARANRLYQLMKDVLTERERDILRVTFQWYDPDKPNQRLPNDVAADLAAQWGTNSENIRQIRGRALRKIKAALEAEKRELDGGQDSLQDDHQ
jgi:RNA polymerase sigma factor (sigma-70 family)